MSHGSCAMGDETSTLGTRPSTLRTWLLAIRPQTLSAALVPVLVGSALAVRDGAFDFLPALAALVGALLIQIGTNLANDVDDFERGADTGERLGPVRVTQSGLLAPAHVRTAAWSAFGVAALVGLYLVAHAGWPIAVLGVLAIVSGWAYTGGPWPLGYYGLGDAFVFLFFGLVAVVGTYFVQAGATSPLVWLASLPVACLVTAILVVNNVRDRATDQRAGKHTLAVRFGDRFGRNEFHALTALAYTMPLLLWLGGSSAWVLMTWVTLPEGWALVRGMETSREGPALNAILRRTARLHLGFGLLLALGLLG